MSHSPTEPNRLDDCGSRIPAHRVAGKRGAGESWVRLRQLRACRGIFDPAGLVRAFTILLLAVGTAARCHAQGSVAIYTDHLVNGFQDWSWAPRDLTNASPVHSGTSSIRVSAAAWQGIAFYHPPFDSARYESLTFWLNGGTAGGQVIQVQGTLDGAAQKTRQLPALAANAWQQFTLPLSALGVDNRTNVDRFILQLTASGSTKTFYLDDVALVAKPVPTQVHVSVSTPTAVRTVDPRQFGVNAAVWDSHFDTPETLARLKEMGTLTLRFPGGSLSDEYHWASNTTGSNTWKWVTSFDRFAHVATNLGAEVFITVNYGSGSAAEAADWVRSANGTKRYGFKYWEIGNECYGSWETDQNAQPHDPYTYATRAAEYLRQMKAADPTIRVGIVAVPGESSSANGNTSHPAYNPRTGHTNYGWTPVVLTTMKALGALPDFLIHHRYPEYTSQESDAFLLQCSTAWAGDAADLRQQLSDYLGPAASGIELVCTENNSNSGAQGRQSTSLVNGLYLADSLAQLMKTEFNGLVWWDLRNSRDTTGSMDPTLYGWRTYGDLGMLDGLTSPYPTFYAAKLMQFFARPGDRVLEATSDYPGLATYAARRTTGAMALLIINKEPLAALPVEVSFQGFTPAAGATLYSYGIPQDEAARTGIGSTDLALDTIPVSGSTLNYQANPYSASVLLLSPTAPRLVILSPPDPGLSNLILRLEGEPGQRYQLQTSPDLTDWISAATYTMPGSSLDLTNAIPSSTTRQFWRAVWSP